MKRIPTVFPLTTENREAIVLRLLSETSWAAVSRVDSFVTKLQSRRGTQGREHTNVFMSV